MYINNSIKIYKRELEVDFLKIFSKFFILYVLLATLVHLPSVLFLNRNRDFLQSEYVYWKLASMGCFLLLSLLIFFNRIHIKYSGTLLTALQIYSYVCFSLWDSELAIGNEAQYMLIIPIIANIDWKYSAVSAFIVNIFEVVMVYQIKNDKPNYYSTLTNFLKSFFCISIAAFIRQQNYQKILSRHETDRASLLHLQNFIKNVIPSSIIVIRNNKVIYQNLETKRLLRYPKSAEIEDYLNKILITEIKIDSVFQSIDGLLMRDNIRLFDYLQRKYNNLESADEFDEIYGKLEGIGAGGSIYDNLSQRVKHFEMKSARILWEGEESVILIMSGDYRAEQRLAEQSRYKDKLLVTVSHGLRTPLNGVIGLLEIVLEVITEKMIKKSLTIALRSSKLLLFLINDILDFTLISNNKLQLNPSIFDVSQEVKEVAKLIKFQAKNKGLKFELVNKFSNSGQVLIKNDPLRINQIILNLLSNALKFTQTGFIRLCLEPHISPFSVKISVEDSGIGIRKEDIPKLFRLFGKLECEENKHINENGIGVGLAVSQGLLRRLNNDSDNDIQVFSEYGKGSLFHFIIRDLRMNSTPNSLVNEAELEENCKIENIKQIHVKILNEHVDLIKESIGIICDKKKIIEIPSLGLREGKFINILVVDDDQINIMVFTTYLKAFSDCKFDLAFNGQQALDIILEKASKNKFYDIIFMDCNMPVMDGFEATRKIVEMENASLIPNVPVVAATANVSPSDYELCFQNGMVDFLSKPFGKHQLREKIEKYGRNLLPEEIKRNKNTKN